MGWARGLKIVMDDRCIHEAASEAIAIEDLFSREAGLSAAEEEYSLNMGGQCSRPDEHRQNRSIVGSLRPG